MTTHVLKRDRQSLSVNFKILLKHTADALPLIEYQLSPFKDYRCNVEPWIEGQTSGNTLTIYTKPIRDPLDSRKFSVSATVSIRDQYAYMKVPYDPHLTLLSHIDDLSGNIIFVMSSAPYIGQSSDGCSTHCVITTKPRRL